MMKRRSMLGRRNSRLLTSPAAPVTFKPPPTIRDQTTPESKQRSPDPFRTPSVNGSLSDIAANEDPWSVFKNGRSTMKSPTSNDNAIGQSQGGPRRESALKANYNRKKALKLDEKLGSYTSSAPTSTKKFDFPVYKHERRTFMADKAHVGFLKVESNHEALKRSGSDPTENRYTQPFPLPVYKHQPNPLISTVAEVDGESSKAESSLGANNNVSSVPSGCETQSPWEQQDLRNLSPPWSASALENTVIQADVTPKASEPPNTPDDKDAKLDLKSALSDVSLGVNSLDILDKHGMGSWSTTSWVPRPPHIAITEATCNNIETDHREELDKENMAPNQQECSADEESQHSDETFLSPPQTSSSASKTSGNDVKKHLERLAVLNARIEEAENKKASAEKRIRQFEEEWRSAEEERRNLEYQRRELNYELLEKMSEAPAVLYSQPAKRIKLGTPSSAKKNSKRPSFIASKLLKKDFRTPVRTGKPDGNVTMNSFLNPFTPKTLRKNINDQYDMIFGE